MPKILTLFMLLTACGYIITKKYSQSDEITPDPQITKINQEVLRLEGVQQQLSNLINSEFATCDQATGETQDVLIRKICNVAKAATSEAQVALLGELSIYANSLNDKIDAVKDDLSAHQVQLDAIGVSITSINSSISSLNTAMVSMQAAITALQTLTAAITGQIASNLIMVEIGSENLSAGPVYESLLLRQDKTRVNGYIEALTPSLAIANNGVTATTGSSIVTVTTLAAHGLLTGNLIRMEGVVSGKGFLSADLIPDLVVLTTPTAATFTVGLARNAASSGAFGSGNGAVTKITGRGLGTLWKTGDASDVAIRQTNFGSKSYNFIIRRKISDPTKAELCYDKTDSLASFNTINASPENGSGNIACK